ncbi:histidinol-phosphatase HisJ [Paenibacillus mendelii]|uniref:Histidinol-phosphatase n=1 Tax=Paenibacillus mendelii TaxID=206163 RepID=A0ABV6JKM0_9BACL|nr:histidinol-phosphatase HisJ [Paenibacillus mendelii]MCQ6563032.1 histidinol-phosphatase HisJ [Paenibacillus mendelii]
MLKSHPYTVRRDGHTHTEYCYHGSGEKAEQYVVQAIKNEFEIYSLTEHTPLPERLSSQIPNGPELIRELAMPFHELQHYLGMAEGLKEKYRDQIELLVGLEVDYIPGMESDTRQLLDSCGNRLEDGVLSVHFLPGKSGWRCVDYTPADFKDGLIDYYGSVDKVYQAYYDAVEQSIESDLGPNKPRRVGHLTLIHKYQDIHKPTDPDCCRENIYRILSKVKAHNMELDFNVAGLFQPACREIYPPEWIIQEALRLNIPMIYGSDSHRVEHVGRGYDVFKEIMGTVSGADGSDERVEK